MSYFLLLILLNLLPPGSSFHTITILFPSLLYSISVFICVLLSLSCLLPMSFLYISSLYIGSLCYLSVFFALLFYRLIVFSLCFFPLVAMPLSLSASFTIFIPFTCVLIVYLSNHRFFSFLFASPSGSYIQPKVFFFSYFIYIISFITLHPLLFPISLSLQCQCTLQRLCFLLHLSFSALLHSFLCPHLPLLSVSYPL